MAASLECRVHLLDHRLVELSQRIPSFLKIRGREKKYILKKALEPLIPRNVLYRKKEGFGAPVKKWVEDYRKKYFGSVFRECFLFESGLARPEELEKFINKDSFNYRESWIFWKILIMEIWCQLYLGNRDYGSIFKIE